MSAPVALVVALAVAAPPPDEVIGGYHDRTELRAPEPEDGEGRVMIGSILFSLGLLRVGVSAASVATTSPTRCHSVYGSSVSDRTCNGLRTFGYVGIGYGTLMVGTGVAFLAWGLLLRERHREWVRRRGVAIAPLRVERGGGVAVGFRF
ncbi:MAG TPA: hypothetical protein PKW35_16795 [Nannocystaceae bacterium]|nr:hypothetical protein [Nannocystaceae bacterium]